ncbi:MAG: GAF domain-containing protein [Anaerolineales bacterium]
MKQGFLAAQIRLFFTPPVFPEDEEKSRQARLLHALLAGSILLLFLGISIAVPLFFVEKYINVILLAALFIVMCLAYRMMRGGRIRLAGYLFTYGLWAVLTLFIFLAGGMLSVVAAYYIVLVVIAGLLDGFRGALVYSIACCLAGLGMILLEASGHPLPRLFPIPPFVGWLDLTVVLFMTTLTVHFAVRDLNSALASTRRRLEERKQAEAALRESEERFARLSSAAYEGIAILDQGRIIDANPQLAGMLGCEPDEIIGRDALDFIAPESRERVSANIRARVEEPYEFLAVRKNGAIFPMVVRSKSISLRGRPVRVSILRDITESKKAETDILRQIERLRALHTIEQVMTSSTNLRTVLGLLAREIVVQLHMDATSILLFDESGQKLTFAAGEGFRTAALRFTNLELGSGLAGEAARKKSIVYIPNLADIRDNPTLAGSVAGEDFTVYFGVPLIAKGRLCGVMEIFHRSAFAMDSDWLSFLETLAGQAAIAIDNARLLEMTQTHLKETEALYRINQGLAATTDPAQLMKDVVTLLQKNLEYTYVQIYLREKGSGDFVVHADSGKIGTRMIEQGHRFAAGEGVAGCTAETGIPYVSNHGEDLDRWNPDLLLTDTKSRLVVPIRSGAQILGVLDVHQAPPAELTQRDVQLVSAAADQLAVALQKAQLYADLQSSLLHEKELRDQLIHSEKLAVTGRLMASVSHELNNPLQAIQNALFLLKDEIKIPAQAQQDLAIVLRETDRMTVLLNRLRTTYKAKAFRGEDFRPVQINGIIEDVRALLATHLRHAKIAFVFDADPALPSVGGVGDQLRQVILNLLMNAVDAMPDGGRLTISAVHRTREKEVLIKVSDTGKGIDPEIQPHLFESFISGKENGTGLGLAICREIVSNHDGRIRAENRPEGGATFHVWLPVAKEENS